VERDAAVELSNEWYDLVRADESLSSKSNSLSGELARLLPATIERGGAAIVNGNPSVLACDPSAVYVIGFAPMSDGKPGVSFARHPLTSDASISGCDDVDHERVARLRHWRFVWPSGVEIAFTSITDRREGWEDGPDSADGVARYMVEKLGWELPRLGRVR
jgi:hypothetical protein